MYDLRYSAPKNLFCPNDKPKPYMYFPEYEGNIHGVMDICPELDLVATGSSLTRSVAIEFMLTQGHLASDKRKIQLFSLKTGRSVTSPPFTTFSSLDPITRDPNPRPLLNQSQRSRRKGTARTNDQRVTLEQNTSTLHPTLTSFTYPDEIKRVCFQTVPTEHGGDGTPSLLVGGGPIVDEWRT